MPTKFTGWATQIRSTRIAHEIEPLGSGPGAVAYRTTCGELSSGSGWRPAEEDAVLCTRCQARSASLAVPA